MWNIMVQITWLPGGSIRYAYVLRNHKTSEPDRIAVRRVKGYHAAQTWTLKRGYHCELLTQYHGKLADSQITKQDETV